MVLKNPERKTQTYWGCGRRFNNRNEKTYNPKWNRSKNELDLNNISKIEPKWISTRCARLYVTYMDLKDIGHAHVVVPYIYISYISYVQISQNSTQKKIISLRILKGNHTLNPPISQKNSTRPFLKRTRIVLFLSH